MHLLILTFQLSAENWPFNWPWKECSFTQTNTCLRWQTPPSPSICWQKGVLFHSSHPPITAGTATIKHFPLQWEIASVVLYSRHFFCGTESGPRPFLRSQTILVLGTGRARQPLEEEWLWPPSGAPLLQHASKNESSRTCFFREQQWACFTTAFSVS